MLLRKDLTGAFTVLFTPEDGKARLEAATECGFHCFGPRNETCLEEDVNG
jgi:hypothetical protein